MCIARHAESTQNSNFEISLQYLKENVNDEVDFLSADNHQRFLQINTIVVVSVPRHAHIVKSNKFAIFCIILRKNC